MKYIAMFVLLFAMSTAHAINSDTVASAGFSNLSDTEKAEVLQIVAQKVASKSNIMPTSAKSLDEWVTLGEHLGKGFAGAARELGMAVNDFVNTPVGKWVAFLIFWKFLGATAIHILFSLLFLSVGVCWIFFYKRASTTTLITYDTTKTDIFGRNRVLTKQHSEISSESAAVIVISMIATVIVSIVTMFSGI